MGLVALVAACAKRTDQRTRDAFHAARAAEAAAHGGEAASQSDGGDDSFDHGKIGWDRVSEVVQDAVEIMRTSPDDERFARIAARWCKVAPEPRKTDQGMVRVCNPEPPVVADGTPFSLEMGGGVIGLVATDLSLADSERLAVDAREAARPLCTEPFRSAAPDPGIALPSPRRAPASGEPHGDDEPRRRKRVEFHICPAHGGPLLTVTRFRRAPDSESWMVVVTVLSPG